MGSPHSLSVTLRTFSSFLHPSLLPHPNPLISPHFTPRLLTRPAVRPSSLVTTLTTPRFLQLFCKVPRCHAASTCIRASRYRDFHATSRFRSRSAKTCSAYLTCFIFPEQPGSFACAGAGGAANSTERDFRRAAEGREIHIRERKCQPKQS